MKTVVDQLMALPFELEKDKELLSAYFHRIFDLLDNDFDRESLIFILEKELEVYTQFDGTVFSGLWKLLHALLSADFFGQHINHQEYLRIFSSLENFSLYTQGVLDDKIWIEETYNIKLKPISFDVDWNHIHADRLDDTHFIAAIPLIKKLLAKYPPLYIHNIRLEGIFVAENFFQKEGGHSCRHLGGLKSSIDNNIYVSFHSIAHSFDHELYHQAMAHYNDIEERANLRMTEDYFYHYQHVHKETHGFAINYGRENIAEDQATVAEFMIRDYDKMLHRAQHDHILQKKMSLVYKAFEKLSQGFVTQENFGEKMYRR